MVYLYVENKQAKKRGVLNGEQLLCFSGVSCGRKTRDPHVGCRLLGSEALQFSYQRFG